MMPGPAGLRGRGVVGNKLFSMTRRGKELKKKQVILPDEHGFIMQFPILLLIKNKKYWNAFKLQS